MGAGKGNIIFTYVMNENGSCQGNRSSVEKCVLVLTKFRSVEDKFVCSCELTLMFFL